MVLKTLSEDIIGVIGSYFDLDIQIKFADVSEITFKVPAYDNGVPTPFYDDIQSYRMVQIDPYGIYVLEEPNVTGDGIQEVKEVSASSIEILLSNRRIVLEEGTYQLSAVLNTILNDAAKDWAVNIHGDVGSSFRTFEATDAGVLDWLRGTAAKSYGCLFDFDPYTKTINVIDAYKDYDVVPIYLSYDNLLKQQDISTSISDFFTVLRVSGADPVTINEVNPNGTNRIYNFNYFIENGDISGALATKVRRWQDEIYLKQDYYTSLNSMYNSTLMQILNQQAKIAELEKDRDSLIGQRSMVEYEISTAQTDAARRERESVYTTLTSDINAKEAEINTANADLNRMQSEIASHNANRMAITNSLKFENYFTEAELNTLYPYIIESDFTDDTFATFDVDIAGSDDQYATAGNTTLRVTPDNEDDVIDVDVASIDPDGIINKRIILMNGGTVDITVDGVHINAKILSGTFEQDKTKKNVVCSIYTGYGTSVSGGETKPFGNGNITITATGASYSSGSNPLSSCSLTNPSLYFTKNTTEFSTYAVQKELYDHATKEHENIAYPGFEFNIKSGNILFAKDFEQFKDVLTPGKGLYLELSDRTILTPLLLEVHLSFEDPTDFDLVFSNTFQRHNNVTNMKELLESARSTARTLDMSKYNYGAFKRNGAENEVRVLFTQGLDAATKQILAGKNNSVVIDGTGITITNPDDPTVCLRMNNGMFAFMDETQHAQLAIGKFYDTGMGKMMYGVVAPNVVGTLLAGENLVIQSPKFDGTNMYFTVDENGVRLANGQFDIYKHTQTGGLDVWGKSISLDPQLGILAGDLDNAIVYNTDGSVKGVKVGNSLVVKSMSELSSVGNVAPNFWVDLDGNVFLKGTIYATNGEFSGVLNASTINGTLTAGANGGDIRGTSIHVGGPDFSNFIVDSNGNVTMNGSVSFGSNLSGDMANFVNNVTSYMENGDAEVTAWFYDEPPTLSNAPASSWTTNALKDEHIGDYYFDKKNDVAYRFAKKSDGTYAWVREANTATVEALRAAAKAQDTADGKRRTFVGSSDPTPPYDVGDLWTNGTDLKTCVMAKAKGQSYAASDWAVQVGYTNDDTANSIANGTYNGGTFIDKKTIYAPAIRGGATLGVGTNANAAKGYNLFVDSDGSIKLGANNNTASKYNFYVDKDGNVVMSGGITLAGNITWSSNTSLPNHVARVFTSTPTVPYSVGDIWVDGSKLYKCKTAKTASQAYNITDWEEAVNYEGKDVVKNIVDGKYTGGTFINGTTISSPKIYGSAILGVGANGAGSSDESKNYNFYVDSSGNVTMRGGINLAGSITWSASNSPTRAVYAMSALAKPADGRTNFPASDTAGSATSTGQWHTTLSSDDYYVSYSYNGGATWTDAIRIRGSNATVTRDSIVTALRNATSGLPDGIYPYSYDDNGTTKYAIGINASYIRAGTIDADEITLSNKYGGLGVGRGSTGQRTTYGPMLYADENPSGTTRTTMDNAMHYAIATNAGVRLTADSGGADSSNIYVNDTYARMVTYRQTAVSIIDAADNDVQLLRRPNVSGWNYNNGDKCARIRLCNGGEGDPVYNLNDYVVVLRSQNKGDNNENLYRRIVVSSKYIFMDESTTITSDADAKNTISYDLDKYEQFFMKLSPASFHYNQSSSGRFHTGFVAQQVESALDESGLTTKDFAGLVIHDQLSEEIEYKYGLRYEEFISLNTYMIQKLYARIEELENQIRLLSGGNE